MRSYYDKGHEEGQTTLEDVLDGCLPLQCLKGAVGKAPRLDFNLVEVRMDKIMEGSMKLELS